MYDNAAADTPTVAEVQDRLADEGRVLAEDAPRRRPSWSSPKMWLPPLVAFGLLIVAWQIYAVHNKYVVPTVPQIFSQLWDQPGLYWHNMLVTLQEAVVGAAWGMGAAFILAVAMCQIKIVERAVMPIAVVLNVTPIIAIAPGLVVAFGFGYLPKYIITAVIVFFPFLINSLIGLRSADPQTTDVLTTLHASETEKLLRLRLPSSLPFLFAGARICMPLAVIGAVVAEFSASGSARGLGSLIITSAAQSNLKTVYASVVVLAVMGITLTLVVVLLQKRFLAWHQTADQTRR
jgi:NitT/TauT family transport system permease protein